MKYRAEIILLSACLIGIYGNLAHSASFNCAKASTYAEKTICANEHLSQLDEEMNIVFKRARSKAENPEAFKQLARQNFKERNACQDEACIQAWLEKSLHMYAKMAGMSVLGNDANLASSSSPSGSYSQSQQIVASQPKNADVDNSEPLKVSSAIKELIDATPDYSIKPTGTLNEMFTLFSDNTDLQRKKMLSEIKGKVVVWTLPVYEVQEGRGGKYIITSSGDNTVTVNIYLTPRTKAQEERLYELKTGDIITVKGILTGDSLFRVLSMDPAIFWK